MDFPRPTGQLAGCCRFPRFAAKVRVSLSTELPFLYRLALRSSVGIDGFSLRHFPLSYRQSTGAAEHFPTDAALAQWFRNLPSVTDASIKTWNR